MSISEKDKKYLIDNFGNLISFKRIWIYNEFLKRKEKIVALFYGNRAGKTSQVAHSYVLRILGKHPVEEKNMRPNKEVRIYRFASQVLPNDPEGGEVKNTQYPFFKKFLPPSLIKRDITIRRPVMTIRDPQGGKDIYAEFVSYKQDVQAMAGVERASIWEDESAPQAFHEEQVLRILTTGGDLVYTLTPAEQLNFEFDEIFENAKYCIRTPSVIEREKLRYSREHKPIEETDSDKSIVVLMASTDDNPTLKKADIDTMFNLLDDEDVVDIRRYGLFRNVSGQIFKDFDMGCHKISGERFFPNGTPAEWKFGRAIDYHEHVPWACVFMALSPDNECFIWDEYNPSPERIITRDIARNMAFKSKDYKFVLNLIDPWAAKKQSNTGLSVVDDLNRIFYELKKEGIGTGGYWTTWDTKSTRGRDEIRMRLKNSKIVGTPFNNKGLPTLWILDNCRNIIESFKNWRIEQWASRESELTKESKDTPQEKWSHFPLAIECMFKHAGWTSKRYATSFLPQRVSPYRDLFSARI